MNRPSFQLFNEQYHIPLTQCKNTLKLCDRTIAFEGNKDIAQFQVRFFGLLAYTVRFPKIAIKHPRIVYTHLLNTGEDRAHLANDDGP